jgi:hypothetical protein
VVEGDERSSTGKLGFDFVGEIWGIETIATGRSIREPSRLRTRYGPGRWVKGKGYAKVCLSDGSVFDAELHWYEAHGIGKRQTKIKKLIEIERARHQAPSN